ncbi:hypothetical protein C0584_03145 [Candidatus Parcubacteria bacterium]|nr:MAG: hypothetical protein C0584_03145 [Candidatus Parcubacteria bacterium]
METKNNFKYMQKVKEKIKTKVENDEMFHQKFNEGVDHLKKFLGVVKKKYDESDPKTKKKIIAGVVSSAGLIAGAIGIKNAHKKHQENKDK